MSTGSLKIFWFCWAVCISCGALRIGDDPTIYASVTYRDTKFIENIPVETTGQIVIGDPIDGCGNQKFPENVRGKILLIEEANCAPVKKAQFAIESTEAIGVIVMLMRAGEPGYYRWSDSDFHSNILVIEVAQQTGRLLKDLSPTTNVTMEITDNSWVAMFGSGAYIFFVRTFLSGFSLTNIGLAIYKFTLQLRLKGTSQPIPLICLVFLMVSNFIRFLAVVDGNTGIFPFELFSWAFTANAPWSLAANFLIVVVWQILTKSSLKVNSSINFGRKFLTKTAIPFFVIFSVFLALDTVGGVLRGQYVRSDIASTVAAVCYFIVCTVTAIFYLTNGIRVLKLISKVHTPGALKIVRLKKTTIKILVSGAGLIGFDIALILIISVFLRPPLHFLALFLAACSLDISDLNYILVFSPQVQSGSSHKSGSNSGRNPADSTDANFKQQDEKGDTTGRTSAMV